MSEPAVRIEGLTKRFSGVEALRSLDLEIARGEVFGYLGPNGAGKTVTIRLLLGLLRPSRGAPRSSGSTVAADDRCAPPARVRAG